MTAGLAIAEPSPERGRAKIGAYSTNRHPDEVTAALGISPSRVQLAGEPSGFPEMGPIQVNGWFWETDLPDGVAESARKIVDVLSILDRRHRPLAKLIEAGWEFDITIVPSESAPHFALTPAAARLAGRLGIQVDILW